jgi:molybdenum cofactor cytidylyltransferase
MRLGQAKQLLQFRDKPLLAHILDVVFATDPLEIIVVTGANAGQVRQAVSHPAVRWVHNPGWADGLGASIALGAGAIRTESDGVLIMLCDQYRVETSDLLELVEAWRTKPEQIVAAKAKGRCMPPVMFPAKSFGALKNLAGEAGAHKLLEDHPDLLSTLAMDSAAFDVDTREQLLRMQPDSNQDG